MKHTLLAYAAVAALGFQAAYAVEPVVTTTMIEPTANYSTTQPAPPLPAVWLVPDVPFGLMTVPMVALVTPDETGKLMPICLKDVRLMFDPAAPGIRFDLVSISDEVVPMDKCPMPPLPMPQH